MSDIELYSAVTDSPVGALTIVASDRGLRAILWPTDNDGRVPIGSATNDPEHPVIAATIDQLEELLLRGAHGVRPAARSGRDTASSSRPGARCGPSRTPRRSATASRPHVWGTVARLARSARRTVATRSRSSSRATGSSDVTGR